MDWNRHFPNWLTYGRLAAVPLFVGAFYLPGAVGHWLAMFIFLVASLTDWLDGYLARKWNALSDMGRMLDPIADKLLVATALVVLVHQNEANVVASALIICRELLVSGMREFLGGRNVVVAVSTLAKWKTAVQMGAVLLLLAGLPLGDAALWLAAALSAITAADYILKAKRAL